MMRFLFSTFKASRIRRKIHIWAASMAMLGAEIERKIAPERAVVVAVVAKAATPLPGSPGSGEGGYDPERRRESPPSLAL